jgi:hypothetical protein
MKPLLSIFVLCGVLAASDQIIGISSDKTRERHWKLNHADPIGSIYKCWDYMESHRKFPLFWEKESWGGGVCWVPPHVLGANAFTKHRHLTRRGPQDVNVSVGVLQP